MTDPASRRWLFLFERETVWKFGGKTFIVSLEGDRNNVMVANIAFRLATDDDAPVTGFDLIKWNRGMAFEDSDEWVWLQELIPSASFDTGLTEKGSLIVREKKDVAKLRLLFGSHENPEQYWSQ